MSEKYHINPETGDPGLCKAKAGKCPFGHDADHFHTKEQARGAYELLQEVFAKPVVHSEATKLALSSDLAWKGKVPRWIKARAKEQKKTFGTVPELLEVIPSPVGPLMVVWEQDSMAENDVHIEIEGGYNINRVTFNELSTGKEVGYLKMAHMDERSLTRSFGDDEWQVFAWADEARGGSFGFSQYKSPKLDDFTKETKLRENLSPEERLEAKRKLWASSHKALGQLPAGFDRSLLTWGDPINLKPEHSPASEEALDKDIDKLRTILSRELAHKIEWHGTPNIDYIRLAPELQGAGMGHALYVFGARRQAKDGKAIRASGIQTPEAQKSWNRMKKAGLPVKNIEIPVNDDGSKELKSGKLLDFR